MRIKGLSVLRFRRPTPMITRIMGHMYVVIGLLFLTVSCQFTPPTSAEVPPESKQTEEVGKKPLTQVPEPQKDSLWYYVSRQVAFGPRVPGTVAHQQCGDYIVQFLKSRTNPPVVTEQITTALTFDRKTIPVRNIIASFYPDRSQRVLLAAHWDTRPFAEMDPKEPHKPIDGANDGGSGVAVLMEIATQLSAVDPGVGVDLIFFDAEDWGDTTGSTEDTYCLGSQYWGKNPHIPDYHARFGILLDMVGGKNSLFAIEENSWRLARPYVQKIWTQAKELGYDNLFIDQKRGPIIDDHFYVMKYRSFPMVDIINFNPKSYSRFGHFWHTHDDNLEQIDPDVLYAVARVVLHVVYRFGTE
jgi:hypothetical protein